MRTRKEAFFLIVALGTLNALTPFSIDLYLPAFPQIARELGTTIARVSLSVSSYFVAFGIGQIFYGPLLDRFGRKRPIYFGLSLYLVGTAGCYFSTSVEMLIAFRFLSAMGGSAASVGATTMVRDLFPSKDGAKIFSALMLVLSVSPMLAPSIGSLVCTEWGWRILFGMLACLAVIDFFIVAVVLPVSYVPPQNAVLSLSSIFRNFKIVFSERQFRTYALSGAFSFASLFVYVTSSPDIYMGIYKVGPKLYGAIFAFLACGMIGGGQLNHLLISRFGSRRVFLMTSRVQAVTAVLFSLAAAFTGLDLVTSTLFLFVIVLCSGVTYPNAAAISLEPFKTNIGSAASLLGFFQLGVGAVVAAILGTFNLKGVLPMAAVMALAACTSAFIVWRGQRHDVKAS